MQITHRTLGNLTTWTDYLVENGLDPANQLCTDDFAGHFAHNAQPFYQSNHGCCFIRLSGRYAGQKDVAEKYTQKAKEMAAEWVKMADDGDHYRLTLTSPEHGARNTIWYGIN